MTDMDAILDEALDELDDDEREESKNEEVSSPPISSKEPSTESNNEHESVKIKENTKVDENKSSSEAFQTMLRDFVEAESNEDDVDEHIETFMNEIDAQLNGGGAPPPPTSYSQEGDVEKDLVNLLEEMAKASIGESSNGHEDDFLREMLGLQDGGSDDFNSDTVIDGMMEQLLSKDLMYEPMKQVTEKFPEWLETNKADLSQKDYQE
jgi:peroxin-19